MQDSSQNTPEANQPESMQGWQERYTRLENENRQLLQAMSALKQELYATNTNKPTTEDYRRLSERLWKSLKHTKELNQKLISQKKQLSETEHRLRFMLQSVRQGYFSWNRITNDTYYSPEYYTLLGYEDQEFVPGFQRWLKMLHPKDRKHTLKIRTQFLSGQLTEYDIESRIRTKSGEYKWFLTKGYLVDKDEQGQWTRLVGIVTEIDRHRKQEAYIRENEARLQLALEVSGQGIWGWHLPTNTYYHTDNYYRLLGYEPQEVTLDFEFWEGILHPDDKLRAVEMEFRCLNGEFDSYKTEYRLRVKDGQYKWFSGYIKVTERDSEGNGIQCVGVILDIDQHKQQEQILQESEEKFRLLIEHNSAAISIYTLDRFIYANPEFIKIFGYSWEELQQLTPDIIIHPDTFEKTEKATYQRPKQGEANNRYELKCITKTADTIWMDLTSLPIYYQGERVNISTMYNITARRRFEQELKDANEDLRTSEEELRQNAEELSAINDTLETAKAQLEKFLENEQIINKKIEKKNRDLYTQKKELQSTLRKLQNTQEHLIQSEKMASLGVLVAGIAHEINNPVNYVSNSCEGLKTILQDIWEVLKHYEQLTPENSPEKLAEIAQLKADLDFEYLIHDTQELLHNISEGANQTAEIVRGLRTFSRLDRSEFEQIDIQTVIDTALLLLQSEYKYDIAIHKEITPNLSVKAQSGKLNQVFINLLSNGIDAIHTKKTEKKGEIFIRTYKSDKFDAKYIAIEIEDNGIGISEKDRKHIFDPFFTTKPVGAGTGLGLPISFGIIEQFKGKIEVESRLNQGTKFIVYLPASEDVI